jgi:hypothetical protein
MSKKNMVWMFTGRQPAKFDDRDKNDLKKTVETEIEKSERLK